MKDQGECYLRGEGSKVSASSTFSFYANKTTTEVVAQKHLYLPEVNSWEIGTGKAHHFYPLRPLFLRVIGVKFCQSESNFD